MIASLRSHFETWRESLDAGWVRLGRWKQVVLVVLVAGPLAVWAALSPGTLVVLLLALGCLLVIVRREALRGREGRLVMGIVLLAFLLRCLGGAAHYYYAQSNGMGVDVFGDAQAYSSSGQVVAENLRASLFGTRHRWPVIGTAALDWLKLLRSEFGWALPKYHFYRIGLFGYLIGTVYALLGLSPIAFKWLTSLVGVLMAWFIYRFLRLEGFKRGAIAALVVAAFYPSLFLWSVSGLKDTWVFLLCIGLLGAYVRGDATRRVSLTAAALGFLVAGPWFIVVAGVLPAASLIMHETLGDRQYYLFGTIILRVEKDRLVFGTIRTAGAGEGFEQRWALKFATVILGSLAIAGLHELRFLPAYVLSLVFLLPVLGKLVVAAKRLVMPLAQSVPRLALRPRIWVLISLVVIIAGGLFIGQREFRSRSLQFVFAQRQLSLNAKTSFHIYPDRFYKYPKNSNIAWKELEQGTLKSLTLAELFAALPRGLVYNLFAPIPSLRGSLMYRAASVQMMLLYGMYLLAAVGGVVSYNKRGLRYWPIWTFLGITLLASALHEGNVGTLFRHRDLLVTIIIAAASVGLVEIFQWLSLYERRWPVVTRVLVGSSEGDHRWTSVGAGSTSSGLPHRMPSVLYVSYNSFSEPVFQSQALAYMKKLAQRGIAFNLITFEKPDGALSSDRLARLAKEMDANGIRCFPRRYHKRPHLISTLYDQMVGAVVCAWHLATKPIDLVHARGVTPAAMVIFPARLFSRPLVFDMRSSLAEAYADAGVWKAGGLWYRLVRRVETIAARKAQKVVVETEAHRRVLLESLDDPAMADKVEVIPCCVDLERFDRVSGKREDGPWELVYLGSLSGWYKFEEMVAFYKVARESWGAGRMAFLTDGPAEEVLRWVAEEGVSEEEVVVESLPFADVPGRLARARAGIVFTEPGRRLESLPVKVGEYLAAGLPLVVNAGMGDTEQLVRSQGVGVVVESFDEEGYRRAASELKALYGSDGSLAPLCREVARTRLSLETGAQRYWALYQSVGDGAEKHQPLPAEPRRA